MNTDAFNIKSVFNFRPLLVAALGIGFGIVISKDFSGTNAFIAMCLFFLLSLISLLFNKKGFSVFFISLLLIFIRVLFFEPIILNEHVPEFMLSLRNSIANLIDRFAFESAPIMKGLIIADKSSIEYLTLHSFKIAGVSHVLALSGLHVTILCSALFMIIPSSRNKLRIIVIVVVLLLYMTISAFPVSLIRASITTLILLLAPMFNRRYDSLSALSLAFIIILLINPEDLYSVSFQLSFAASAMIAMLYKPLIKTKLFSKLPSYLGASICVSIASSLGTLPLIIYHFGYFSPYSLIANLYIVPLVSPIMVLSLIALPFCAISNVLGRIAMFPSRILIGSITNLSDIFASFPLSSIHFSEFSVISCVLFYIALIALSSQCIASKKAKYIFASAAFIAFALSLFN